MSTSAGERAAPQRRGQRVHGDRHPAQRALRQVADEAAARDADGRRARGDHARRRRRPGRRGDDSRDDAHHQRPPPGTPAPPGPPRCRAANSTVVRTPTRRSRRPRRVGGTDEQPDQLGDRPHRRHHDQRARGARRPARRGSARTSNAGTTTRPSVTTAAQSADGANQAGAKRVLRIRQRPRQHGGGHDAQGADEPPPAVGSRAPPHRPQCAAADDHRGQRDERPHRHAVRLVRGPRRRVGPGVPVPATVSVNDHDAADDVAVGRGDAVVDGVGARRAQRQQRDAGDGALRPVAGARRPQVAVRVRRRSWPRSRSAAAR